MHAQATKGDVKAAISRLEGAITFRRTVKIEEVQAMAEDCELEVSPCIEGAYKSLHKLFSNPCMTLVRWRINGSTDTVRLVSLW